MGKNLKFGLFRFVKECIYLIIFVILFSSCEKQPDGLEPDESFLKSYELNDVERLKCQEGGKLVDFELISSYSSDQLKAILGASFAPIVKYGVELYKVSYLSEYKGKIVQVSGAVCLPDIADEVNLPVAMYNHGTRISEADQIPSGGLDVITLLTASYGYICYAADYTGFGDSKQIFHPYLVNSASDPVVCDMISAGDKFLKVKKIKTLKKFFMFGFSQGALVTMSAQRLIENVPGYKNKIKLSAVAMATGPYDLHNNTLLTIVSKESYSAPAFIVFSFISYNQHYNFRMDLNKIFKNNYGQLFLDLLAQGKGYNDINPQLPTGLSDLFQDKFRSDFIAGKTKFNPAFQKNSTINGWVPVTKTRIYSSPADEIVPYANAQTAYEKFVDAGSQSVELITLPSMGHVNSAFVSYMDILSWFDTF